MSQIESREIVTTEIRERAFAIFLVEGLEEFLEEDQQVQDFTIMELVNHLRTAWEQMESPRRDEYIEQARDSLQTIRATNERRRPFLDAFQRLRT